MSEKPPDGNENPPAIPTDEYKYNFYLINTIKEIIYIKVSSGIIIDSDEKKTPVTLILMGFNKEQTESHEPMLDCHTIEPKKHLAFRAKNPIPRFILVGDEPEHFTFQALPCDDIENNVFIAVLVAEPKIIDLAESN